MCLPNLLAGREIVPELLQDECRSDLLANALLPLLQGGEAVDKLRETFLELHQKIRLDADNQAAQAVSDIASN